MSRRKPRHQVVLMMMPGAEPWIRVQAPGGSFSLPAGCSLLELWELLAGGVGGTPKVRGEIYARVPLRDLPF